MPVIYRAARAEDLQQAGELVVHSLNDLCERHGFGPMATVRPPIFSQFSLRDDPNGLWVSLLERNQINGFVVDESLDVANERFAHRHNGGRGRKALAPVHSKISDHSPHGLQVWHVYVEVHPIDRFKLKHNMVTHYIGHRSF